VFFAGCSSSNEPKGPVGGGYQGGGPMLSYKVPDVPVAFQDLDSNGNRETFNMYDKFSSVHLGKYVQGYAQCQRNGYKYFFSGNASDGSYLIVTENKNIMDKVLDVLTPKTTVL